MGIALALVQQEYFFAISLLSVHQHVLPLTISFDWFKEVYVRHFGRLNLLDKMND